MPAINNPKKLVAVDTVLLQELERFRRKHLQAVLDAMPTSPIDREAPC